MFPFLPFYPFPGRFLVFSEEAAHSSPGANRSVSSKLTTSTRYRITSLCTRNTQFADYSYVVHTFFVAMFTRVVSLVLKPEKSAHFSSAVLVPSLRLCLFACLPACSLFDLGFNVPFNTVKVILGTLLPNFWGLSPDNKMK